LVDNGDIDTLPYIRYKELLNNFIQPMLIQYSYYLSLDNFFVKFMNIGLVQNRSEQGNPIDIRTLTYLKNNAKNLAEFQDNLLRRHLVFNSWKYPQYTLTSNNGDKVARIFSLSFDPNRDDKFDSMILETSMNYKKRHNVSLHEAATVVLKTCDIFTCQPDGSVKMLKDDYLQKIIVSGSLGRIVGKTTNFDVNARPIFCAVEPASPQS